MNSHVLPQKEVAEMGKERTNTFNSCLDSNWFVASMVFIILKYWSSILFLLNPVTGSERLVKSFPDHLSIQVFVYKSFLPDNAVE